MFSEEFLQNVKQSTDLIELVEEYGEDVIPMGDNIWGCKCPHPDHQDDTPSFRIIHNSNDSWTWYCGGCHMGKKDLDSKNDRNFGSDCFAFVQWMSNHKGSKHTITFPEAVKFLAQRKGIPVEDDPNTEIYREKKLKAKIANIVLRNTPSILKYLRDRGLTNETINEWQLGIIKNLEGGKRIDRIVFPLYDKYSNIHGISGRRFPDADPNIVKYWNSPSSDIFNKRRYLYGIHKIDPEWPELRITEGAMDVVVAHQMGAKNIVCTLGTALTEDHIPIIKSLKLTPCLCMDGDEAGQKGIRKALKLLAAHNIYAKVIMLPNDKDLADIALELGDKLEAYLRKHTLNYWEYLLMPKANEYESRINQIRMEYMGEITKALGGTTTPEDIILMKSYVKEHFGVNL